MFAVASRFALAMLLAQAVAMASPLAMASPVIAAEPTVAVQQPILVVDSEPSVVLATPPPPPPPTRLNAEKLRRGLSNFINQINPAAFFVPSNRHLEAAKVAQHPAAAPQLPVALAQQATEPSAPATALPPAAPLVPVGAPSEPAALVNHIDTTGEAILNRPSRLSQPKLINGRWGR